MSIKENVPEYFRPVVELLEAKIDENPEAVDFGYLICENRPMDRRTAVMIARDVADTGTHSFTIPDKCDVGHPLDINFYDSSTGNVESAGRKVFMVPTLADGSIRFAPENHQMIADACWEYLSTGVFKL